MADLVFLLVPALLAGLTSAAAYVLVTNRELRLFEGRRDSERASLERAERDATLRAQRQAIEEVLAAAWSWVELADLTTEVNQEAARQQQLSPLTRPGRSDEAREVVEQYSGAGEALKVRVLRAQMLCTDPRIVEALERLVDTYERCKRRRESVMTVATRPADMVWIWEQMAEAVADLTSAVRRHVAG